MKTIRENNVMGLADANVIKNEVLGVKGLKMNELVALKETNTKAAVDAKETERSELLAGFNMGGMTGGTNVPAKPVDAPLSEVETAYVRSKEEAGMTVDIKRLRRIQAKGSSSLEENLSAMEASK